MLEVAKTVRNKEHMDLAQMLRDLLNQYLPDDAHKRLANRLYVSVTILRGLQCALITDFHSKDHLIQVRFRIHISHAISHYIILLAMQ